MLHHGTTPPSASMSNAQTPPSASISNAQTPDSVEFQRHRPSGSAPGRQGAQGRYGGRGGRALTNWNLPSEKGKQKE